MTTEWKEDQPIYRQLRDLMADAILKGSLQEGESLPSVRTVAVDMQINPLTASKAYQELVNEEINRIIMVRGTKNFTILFIIEYFLLPTLFGFQLLR